MKKRVSIAVCLALGTALILTLYLPGIRPENRGFRTTLETQEAAIGGPFEMINHNGNLVTEQILKGQYSLIYFGFTFCPDICPLTLQIMTDALNRLNYGSAQKVNLLFISLDPQRDTFENLAYYINHFHPTFIGLTGSADQVRKTADAFRVFYKKRMLGDGNDYTIDHSGFTYLMDQNGRYLDHFDKDVTADKIVSRLEFLE